MQIAGSREPDGSRLVEGVGTATSKDDAAGRAEITVVITSHNAGDRLRETLDAIRGGTHIACVHVVDSGSTDGSLDGLDGVFPEVRLTRFSTNVGPCVTRNAGANSAETPYVLFLDDDMALADDVLPLLLSELRNRPDCALVGARIHYADGDHVIQYDGGLWHYSGLPHMRHLGQCAPAGAPLEVDVLTTSCLLARRDVWLAVGGLREELFYLFEDVELSVRLRYLGWKLVHVPAAWAWNRGASRGLSLKEGAHYPGRRVFYHSRNRVLVLLSHYRVETLLLIAPALLFFELVWFAFGCLSAQPLAYVRGKAAVLRLLPAILRWRRELEGRRVLADRDLLGAPSLSFTPTALQQPLVRHFAAVVDGVMRVFWCVVRGAVR